MEKFSRAIHTENWSEIAALCADSEALQDVTQVPVESDTPKISQMPLKRSSKQSALFAWKTWFKTYGIAHLKYKRSLSGNGVYCMPLDEDSFYFTIEYFDRGYLIVNCRYSV